MELILPAGARFTLTQGFRFFWGWYVTGFNPQRHCQPCLLGRRSRLIARSMPVGHEVELNERDCFDYFYVCGVASTGRWENNFHLAVRARAGNDAQARCYTGQLVIVRNAERIEISALPDGFNGKDRSFTTCRNYQFGVQVYQLRDGAELAADGTYGYGSRHRERLRRALQAERDRISWLQL